MDGESRARLEEEEDVIEVRVCGCGAWRKKKKHGRTWRFTRPPLTYSACAGFISRTRFISRAMPVSFHAPVWSHTARDCWCTHLGVAYLSGMRDS
jgi:hypothetical protein